MSGRLEDKALKFFNAAKSQQERGLFKDSLKNYLISLNIQEKLVKSDPFFNTWISMTLNNLGTLLSDMGQPAEAQNRYEHALEMRESLLDGKPDSVVYQSDVAMTLNNLGNLLSDMGQPVEAENSYDRALTMYESLLAGEPGNVVYQSQVATTLNNLGTLLKNMGQPVEAQNRYERALKMRESLLKTDPENSIYQSRMAKTFLQLWELMINSADSKGPGESFTEYKKASQNLQKKASYFQDLGLKYESFLAKKLGLSSELKYNVIAMRFEMKPEKRISGYRKCVEITSILADIESDKKQQEEWSGMAQYYEGRALVNESIIRGFNRDILEKAVETFKTATNSCEEAYPCYCVYDILLKITGLSNQQLNWKDFTQRIDITTQQMSTGESTKVCLLKIKKGIERGMGGADITAVIQELNDSIIDIEYSALREVFKYAKRDLGEYFNNAMEASVKFQDWSLDVEISGIQGSVKIRTKENVLWEGLVQRKLPLISFEPKNRIEKITFESVEHPHIKGEIPVPCYEIIDNQRVFFLKRSAL